MLAIVEAKRKEASQKLDQSKRSELGQFMTPKSIAEFMASLFEKINIEDIKLLDAGAGIGTLSSAFFENVQKKVNVKRMSVSAYEIDKILLPYLKSNLTNSKKQLASKGKSLTVNIKNADFIKEAVTDIVAGRSELFTHAILNPPYAKINSQSDHRKLFRLAKIETVNLYSGFVALALKQLKSKGELVAIIPRSFCNGNYYRSFREQIIKTAAIKQIHLFNSRNTAFKDDDVLQENVIIHLIKDVSQGKVIISKSTDQSLKDFITYKCLFEQIVKPNDKEVFFRIPHAGKNEIESSKHILYSLEDLGLSVSTGPVVGFRSKRHLLKDPIQGSIPLLYPIHFNGKEMDWPKQSKRANAIALNEETIDMIFPSGFYTVVRRFSSKEEKQRIVARVINPKKFNASFLGFENSLNVIHFGKKEINSDLAYGIAAYLNSSFVDDYFRSFNGHTQVNATDLRQMKYPALEKLKILGKWSRRLKDFEQGKIDKKIKEML